MFQPRGQRWAGLGSIISTINNVSFAKMFDRKEIVCSTHKEREAGLRPELAFQTSCHTKKIRAMVFCIVIEQKHVLASSRLAIQIYAEALKSVLAGSSSVELCKANHW